MINLDLSWDRDAHTGDAREHCLRVRVASQPEGGSDLLPVSMAIALDCSSSMDGKKLSSARQACESVVRLLRPSDQLCLCGFSGAVTPLLEGVRGAAAAAQVTRAIASVSASGVTRTDLALDWIAKSLASSSGTARIGILITDGHPTDWSGKVLADTSALRARTEELGRSQAALFTIGLGDADQFNAGFLADIAQAAFGKYIYAPDPAGLEGQLRTCLVGSQNSSRESAKIRFRFVASGAEITRICRMRPNFTPLDAANEIQIGALRADAVTDVLAMILVPGRSGFGLGSTAGESTIAEVTVITGAESVTSLAKILYTDSYTRAQKLNATPDQDRRQWDMELWKTRLAQANTIGKTVDALEGLRSAAKAAGDQASANAAERALREMKGANNLSGHSRSQILSGLPEGDKA